MPTVALMTDMWPSADEPHSGAFVRSEVQHVGRRFRHVVLVPRLVAPGLHRRIWGLAVQGWQKGHLLPEAPHRLLRYPIFRVPKGAEPRSLSALAAMRLAGERPSLVHGHFLVGVGPAAVRVAKALGIPSVLTVHGTDARWLLDGNIQQRFRDDMRWAAASADRILAVSSEIADGLRSIGVPAERLEVVAMGADSEIFRIRDRKLVRRRLLLGEDVETVLFVGRLTEAKGASVLEDALRYLRRRKGRLECVAAGPVVRPSTEIRSLGVLDAEELALWMSAADVVCLPSFGEGTPVSLLEALACGTPVVATSVGGVPDVLIAGENGLLVPPGDVEALAEGLAATLARDWSPEKLRASSEPYWWSHVSTRIANVYAGLLA